MRTFLLLASVLTVTACASTNVQELRAPDGSVIRSVKCVSDSGKCLAAAADTCANAMYQVLDSSSNSGGALADLIPGPFTWYRMQFKCGPSDGTLPAFAFRGPSFVPPPVIQTAPRRTTTTNCQTFGNQVNCTSY